MPDSARTEQVVTIKKYANRRLYNTETSSYITLDHLATMVRENRDFKVVDAKTGEDITRPVLTQIIVEEEGKGQTMLPVNFLRQLIAMYGDGLQSMVPDYLEASMDAFRRNQEQFRNALSGAFGPAAFTTGAFAPLEQLAKQNMAMFEVATGMLTRGGRPEKPEAPAEANTADELRHLRDQMQALQAKLDKISG
jgi:polyhydroxyalkanoate synthesis repressor PhaR